MRTLLLTLIPALVLLASSPPLAAATGAPPAPPQGSIVITSAPNGDLLGYRIVILPDGSALAEDGAGKAQSNVAAQLMKTLVTDLDAAMPLSQLPGGACAPGQTAAPNPVTVSYRSQISPDLSCARDAREAALYGDVQTIAHSMYVANYRSRAVTMHGASSTDTSLPAPAPPPAPSMPTGGYGGHGYM